ncbi:MAG TPA: HAD family hydrolase [Armatimonadota bacterium]
MTDLGNGIWASDTALRLGPSVDAIVFDVDGVLLNVSGSFRKCISATTQFFLAKTLGWEGGGEYLPVSETELFKRAGGFNNDWSLAECAILLFLCKGTAADGTSAALLRALPPSTAEYTAEIGRRGGGEDNAVACLTDAFPADIIQIARALWDKDVIDRIFMEMYAGRTHCKRVYGFEPTLVDQERGELLNETVLLDTPALTDRYRYGIVSGRLRGELDVALEMTGLRGLIDRAATMTADDGLHKPDPNGLIVLADRMSFAAAAFVGDTLDDMRTVHNYRKVRTEPGYLACQVLSGPAGEANRQFFADHGADVVAPDVNALMRWFESL